MGNLYKEDVIDPGDKASALAGMICCGSHSNSSAIIIKKDASSGFRGAVDFSWNRQILGLMSQGVMSQHIQNDGAGGKPQFFTLVGTEGVFAGLGWEIITMTADDFARSGRFPVIIDNEIGTKYINDKNFHLVSACLNGYGEALKKSGLVNITGEIAIMKHSVTAFCDDDTDDQFILNWGASCTGLVYEPFIIDPSKITPDMPIVGFEEDGYRCNGGTFFTNLILAKWGPNINDIRNNPEAMEFVKKLAVPSVSYARLISRIVGWNNNGTPGGPLAKIAGIAHITGGGVWGKFGELLPEGVGAILNNMPNPPPILLKAQEYSQGLMLGDKDLTLTDWQAYGTLHGGCGMLVVCEDDEAATEVCRVARKHVDGIGASIVGRTTDITGNGSKLAITSRFREGGILTLENPQ